MDSQYLKKLLQRIGDDEKSIDFIISTTPTVLDSNNSDVIKAGNYYLPYSTGFEMEFDNDGELTKEQFAYLNLLDLQINNSEQRFRITNGIKGLKQLFGISKVLRKNAIFSDYSGIHYHVDCTGHYDLFDSTLINEYWEWIEEELRLWDYRGTYNKKGYCGLGYGTGYSGSWLRFNSSFKTMEFRIGNMAFDYKTLFLRIVHANFIVKTIKVAAYKNYKAIGERKEIERIKTESPILMYKSDKKIDKLLTKRIKKI